MKNSPNINTDLNRGDDYLIAWLSALAIMIHLAESAFPSPLPGIKPGFANIVTIIVWLHFGWRIGIWVSLLRVVIGSLLLGSFLSPTFFLSLSGALATIIVLSLASLLPGRGLSIFGLCLLSAIAHISGQFWLAFCWFIPHQALLHLYPILLTASFFMGTLSGIIGLRLVKYSNILKSS